MCEGNKMNDHMLADKLRCCGSLCQRKTSTLGISHPTRCNLQLSLAIVQLERAMLAGLQLKLYSFKPEPDFVLCNALQNRYLIVVANTSPNRTSEIAIIK
uniref:(northern house mosquito) hypothetical protein n=1 Tax=Culex pipiens TaxID=7175 RepID=A0A8D8AH08_CULPI